RCFFFFFFFFFVVFFFFMESLNALLQGMGLMHLGTGQAIMLLVSLLLLWLAIAKKFEPLLLLPIGFGGLL
ncbi:oxaloacetate decarboxylase subunit beta, partial [Salmonella enterica subsp. enterica serovar Newport str. SHSN005]